MADILKIARDFNPKKALTHIFDKIDEIIGKLNILWSNAPTVTPKVYKALLTQSGTDAPVVSSELVNTLGQTPTYSYVGAGDYKLIVTGGIFVKAKTAMIIAQNIGGGGPIDIIWNSTNDLAIELPSDNILDYTLVLIEVYP